MLLLTSLITAALIQPDALTTIGGALTRISENQQAKRGWTKDGNSWLLLPPSTPWASLHFVGGAGFGSAPEICYDALLQTLVRRLGVAVVATPYDVATDHWALSNAVHDEFDRALLVCRERSGLSANAPTYRLGHSLGAKLLVLGALGEEEQGLLTSGDEERPPAAEEQADDDAASKLGLLAFNNFDLSDSAELAAAFLARLQGGDEARMADNVKSAFDMAKGFASMAGIDFGVELEVTPNPQELEDAVAKRYKAQQTTMWKFTGDALDSSDGLLNALPAGTDVARSTLDEGARGHLTPVAFRLEAADIDPTLAMLLGSNQGFTFGDAEDVEPLCDEICEWMWPKGMARRPVLSSSGEEELEEVVVEVVED